MPRPSRRDELVDAAIRVFERSGFRGAGLDEVLAEGGFARATVYHHFGSKDELAAAAVRRAGERRRRELARVADGAGDDPHERLDAVIEDVERALAAPRFPGCLFLRAASEFEDPCCPIRGAVAEHRRLVERWLAGEIARLPGVDGDDAAAELAAALALVFDGAMAAGRAVGAEPATLAAAARRASDAVLSSVLPA